MTIVCGDSHTTTHGAFGALAFGIGTTEVEQVLATQCLVRRKPKAMLVQLDGALPPGVSAKDAALAVVSELGMAGGTGHVIEFGGRLVSSLTMEQRMTLCNMSIEAGATAALVAPDEVTFSYLAGRRFAPGGRARGPPPSRDGASSPAILARPSIASCGSTSTRSRRWSPGARGPTWWCRLTDAVPNPQRAGERGRTRGDEACARIHGARAGHADDGCRDRSRVHRLVHERAHRGSARRGAGRARASRQQRVHAMVVPGSERVKAAAEREGLDRIFRDAGFEWREPGCSMCLGMNPDMLRPGERSASTSNRNFEGRQGRGGRTHLVSPAMAAAAAIRGHFADVRGWEYR